MGCDIHCYVEYCSKQRIEAHKLPPKEGEKRYPLYWRSFTKRINPGRNYAIFGILSDGVRYDNPNAFKPKGLPTDLGMYASDDAYHRINDKYAEDEKDCDCEENRYVTLEKAQRWAKSGETIFYNEDGTPDKVTDPDWHSHSWLTTQEFEQALNIYRALPDGEKYFNDLIEYRALLSAMKTLEEAGNVARIVFWFDN